MRRHHRNRTPYTLRGFTLGSGIGLRRARPDRRAVTSSLLVHAGLLGAFLLAGVLTRRDLPDFENYRVRIFSPPPQVQGPPAPRPQVAQTIVSAPRPETPRPRQQAPEVRRTESTPVEGAKPEKTEPVAGAAPKPDSPGGDNLDVDMAGQEFPYPAYLENIIRQINRYFRWSRETTPEVVLAFYIQRDGSVGGLQVVEKSGDFFFDLEAQKAVELAGRQGAFGPLPEDWVQDRLWVRFRLLPPGG
ncbi:MAG: TonB C-terminal domain-containing protein [Gemmatimonadetes bacterium]|nr:TonB C-terminal domain-containing protein [Gemmatimonadota bacterium]